MVRYPEDSACISPGEGLTLVSPDGSSFEAALHILLERLAVEPREPELTSTLLATLTTELDTSGGNVLAVRTLESGVTALVPHARSGHYDALLRDMPPIEIDSPLEAARVFSEKTPHFVDSVHAPDSSERSGATSRWRDLISTHSSATLPLIAAGEPLGVLSLQWASQVRFGPTERSALSSIATVIALALAAERSTDIDADAVAPFSATETPDRRETLAVRVLGASRDEGGRDPESVLVADIEVAGDCDFVFEHSEDDESPVRVLVLAPSPDADAVPQAARMLASAAIGLSGSPKEWFASINRVLTENTRTGDACGVFGVQAWGALLDPSTGALLETSAGTVSTLLTRPNGDERQAEVKKLPLGLWKDEAYPERPQLLLPGDTLEVCVEGGPDLTLHYLARAPQ